jgi:hypothetical protein
MDSTIHPVATNCLTNPILDFLIEEWYMEEESMDLLGMVVGQGDAQFIYMSLIKKPMGTQSTRAKAIYEEWRSQTLSTNISKQSGQDKPNLENQESDSQATISLWSNRNRIEL